MAHKPHPLESRAGLTQFPQIRTSVTARSMHSQALMIGLAVVQVVILPGQSYMSSHSTHSTARQEQITVTARRLEPLLRQVHCC